MSIPALFMITMALMALLTIPSYRHVSKKKSAPHPTPPYGEAHAKLYDALYDSSEKTRFELSVIEEGHVLDVGCGVGHLVGNLPSAVGLDASPHMISEAKKRYPDRTFKVGNATDLSLFQKESFSTVACVGYTLYYMPEKLAFFENAYQWLEPEGFMVVQLSNERMKLCPHRKNFKHKGRHVGNVWREQLEFNGSILHSEHVFYYESMATITELAERAGFKLQAKTPYPHDPAQFLAVFQKREF
jgi:ubiquinone/menaquinone biosynthesis C-methylase UbiE